MPSPPGEAASRFFDADKAATTANRIGAAARDIGASFQLAWCWLLLARQDIRRRYPARSLGPAWITLHSTVMIVSIGLVLSQALGIPYRIFIPYLATGWIIWQFVATNIAESPSLFLDATLVTMTPHPLFVQVLRQLARNLLVLACNLPVATAAFLLLRIHQPVLPFQALAGLVLLVINAAWLCMLIGLLGARHRDIQQIATVAMQPLFFLTPVLWPVRSLGSLGFLADINPLYFVLESIRSPLLGIALGAEFWMRYLLISAGGVAIVFLAFARFRARIPYWL